MKTISEFAVLLSRINNIHWWSLLPNTAVSIDLFFIIDIIFQDVFTVNFHDSLLCCFHWLIDSPTSCHPLAWHINYWFSDFYVLIFEIWIYELLIDQSFCPYFCVLMIINHYLKNLPYTVGLQCLFKNYLLPEVEQHLHTSALLESRHRLKKVMT